MVETTLVKVSEVARRLGVSKALVYKMMDAGSLPYVQISGARRIPLDGIEDFIRDHTTHTTTPVE